MKKFFARLFASFLVFLSFSVSAYADAGPKSSIDVHVRGIDGKYVVTLLSKEKSTGPYSVGNNIHYKEESAEHKSNVAKLLAFKDEYYNLSFYEELEGEADFTWGYYPPTNFKVLIYSVDKDEYYLSDIHSAYAFRSFYNADLVDGKLLVSKDMTKTGILTFAGNKSGIVDTILMFLFTLLFTLIIELLVALLFRYRGNDLSYITKVNIGTQIFLYLVLSIFLRFIAIPYILLLVIVEFIIFVAEMIFYASKFENRAKAVIYGLLANGVSYFLGAVFWMNYIKWFYKWGVNNF